MTIRFHDDELLLTLSVGDLLRRFGPQGHLTVDSPSRSAHRLARGQQAHRDWQQARAAHEPGFQAEVVVRRELLVGRWRVELMGRIDGLSHHGEQAVVEELKTTILPAGRLYGTAEADWPLYVAQLQLYLWLLDHTGPVSGELILTSLTDGAQHVIGVPSRLDATADWASERLHRLIDTHERWQERLTLRRSWTVPEPFDAWREGQAAITEQVHDALLHGGQTLVQAPTGLGKTAAVLQGALRHGLAHDRRLFWATARNTQRQPIQDALQRLRDRGLPVRSAALQSKASLCLMDEVHCHPDACPHADGYHDKVHGAGLLQQACKEPHLDGEWATEQGTRHEVCPHQLLVEAAGETDVVIGDMNLVFSPGAQQKRWFGPEQAETWTVVSDEAHQLVDRARGWGSPSLSISALRLAHEALQAHEATRGSIFAHTLQQALAWVWDVLDTAAPSADGWSPDGWSVLDPLRDALQPLADQLDVLGFEMAVLRQLHDDLDPERHWQRASRALSAIDQVLREGGEHHRLIGGGSPGQERLQVVCLHPGFWTGQTLPLLGGWIGASATLDPPDYYRRTLDLSPEATWHTRSSPFDPARRLVLVSPRISTLYADRVAHAERTARLLWDCMQEVPGHVAVYFPSFAMAEDITSRWPTSHRPILRQSPGMSESDRRRLLSRLSPDSEPATMVGIAGGIFAEGIDLPRGALRAVFVVGPCLPPIGLEHKLITEHLQQQWGEGFLYGSLIPGLTRVIQAAGRLIRHPEDHGAIVLFGRRFRWPRYAELLPPDWSPQLCEDPTEALSTFFQQEPA